MLMEHLYSLTEGMYLDKLLELCELLFPICKVGTTRPLRRRKEVMRSHRFNLHFPDF